jgi:hypothetical protein
MPKTSKKSKKKTTKKKAARAGKPKRRPWIKKPEPLPPAIEPVAE